MAPHLDVLDASEYPSDHTFFCSSQDTLPTAVSSVTESVHEDGAVAIHDLLLKLLERIAKRLGSTGTGQGAGAASDDEDDDEEDDTGAKSKDNNKRKRKSETTTKGSSRAPKASAATAA